MSGFVNRGSWLPRLLLVTMVTVLFPPPQSESSGAITDISSNACSSASSLDSLASNPSAPIGEIPELVLKGAKVGQGRGSSDDSSMLNFGQGDPPGGQGNPRVEGFASTVEPAREIEVIL